MLEKFLSQKADKKECNARLTAYAKKLDRMIGGQSKETTGDPEKTEDRK